MELTYQDYLKLDTLVYMWRFSHMKYDSVGQFTKAYYDEYVDLSRRGELKDFHYHTMFNGLYRDEDSGIVDMMINDEDLQSNGKLGKLKYIDTNLNDDRYFSVCLVKKQL